MTLPLQDSEMREQWNDICKKEAMKMDRFSALQRSGIAGSFQILGWYFFLSKFSSEKEKWIRGEIARLTKMLILENTHNDTPSSAYTRETYTNNAYNRAIQKSLSHWQKELEELIK